MKRNQTAPVPVRLHEQIYQFHDPPTPHQLPSALPLCLPQSFYLSLSPFPFSPPKFNLVFASDGEELGSFMPGAVEYIKLQEKYK